MGHSAGAHLVSLLTVRPHWLATQPKPCRATVALDSAAYDIEKIMQTRHARFYDQAFGDQPSNWKALSPIAQLHHFSLYVQPSAQTNPVFKLGNLFNKHKNSELKPNYCLSDFHMLKSTSH